MWPRFRFGSKRRRLAVACAPMRIDGRSPNELRPWSIEPDFIPQALGSALVTAGRTRVICTANLEPKPPGWLEAGGWVTAQYAMLPGATRPRGSRDPGGRGKEIQRLIGRSLRAAVDLAALRGPTGPLSLICDCDVIEADGGTRTAAITGAYVALVQALHRLREQRGLADLPLLHPVAAVSVGMAEPGGAGAPVAMLDLCYHEDARAHVDLNLVTLHDGGIVEVQGTAERGTFGRAGLDQMLQLGSSGLQQIFAIQAAALRMVG